MSRIDFSYQLQLQDLHTRASEVFTICLCTKSAETAWKPQTLPLSPQIRQTFSCWIIWKSFFLSTNLQPDLELPLPSTKAFSLVSTSDCQSILVTYYNATIIQLLTQGSQRNFRAFYKGCQYCYCSFMTVKNRHRMHLSIKNWKTPWKMFFLGEGILFYYTEMRKIELLQLFSKAKQFYWHRHLKCYEIMKMKM